MCVLKKSLFSFTLDRLEKFSFFKSLFCHDSGGETEFLISVCVMVVFSAVSGLSLHHGVLFLTLR